MDKFLNDVFSQLQTYYEDIVAMFPRLVLAIVVFTVLFFLANASRNYVNKRLSSRMDDPLLARFIARLTKTTLVIIALMIVLKIVGLTDIVTGLITGASVSAIVVGFAFKDIGENLLAGIMLAFDRPFRVGDLVELESYQGKVISLNLRNCQIKSFDGQDIYIPNANIIKNPVINYTIDGFRRYDFDIGLDYGSDVDNAREVILNILKSLPGILKDEKAPSVVISSLGTSTLNLTAYYWLDTFDNTVSAGEIKTKALDRILNQLVDDGFNLPGDIIEIKNYQNKPVEMKQNPN